MINLDSLSKVMEFCVTKERRGMMYVSKYFKEAFDISREACSLIGLRRIRGLLKDPEYGGRTHFYKMITLGDNYSRFTLCKCVTLRSGDMNIYYYPGFYRSVSGFAC